MEGQTRKRRRKSKPQSQTQSSAKLQLDAFDIALKNLEKEQAEEDRQKERERRAAARETARKDKQARDMSPEAMHKLVQRVYAGNQSAIERLFYYVNYTADEVNKRMDTLRRNELDISTVSNNLNNYLYTYNLDEMPKRDINDPDIDISEVVGQAQATRRFLSSPLSRVSHVKEYMRRKVDYVLDPEGRIQLETRLGRKLSPQERGFLGKMLMDSPLTDYINEEYAQTGEVLEAVIDEFDMTKTIKQNMLTINAKLSSALNTRTLIQTRFDAYWQRRNSLSLKTKGAKNVTDTINIRN